MLTTPSATAPTTASVAAASASIAGIGAFASKMASLMTLEAFVAAHDRSFNRPVEV